MDVSLVWLLAVALLLFQFEASTTSVTSPVAEEGPLTQLAPGAHRRERRCSCENQKDKECIFFCHIGIVWVNTPSRLVPYGVGPVRLRREVTRCLCSHTRDGECVSFCSVGTGGKHPVKTDERLKIHRAAFWEKRNRHAVKRQT